MILVHTKKVTNRVKFIFRLLLEDILGVPVGYTVSPDEFLAYPGPKLAYGLKPDEGQLFFAAQELLFENGISVRELRFFPYEGSVAFFAVYDQASCLPFDPFAASFYLVSRYEEYLPHRRDKHGRFLASGSDAFRQGFLQKPLVNLWAEKLGEILVKHHPGIQLRKKAYSFIPTIDIDAAYAYKHKGITRSLGGLMRSLLNSDFPEALERIRVLMNRQRDPFDTFDYLLQVIQKYNLRPCFFVLMADYGPLDKNIPVNNRNFQQVIKLLADYAEVGIHPSYASASDPQRLGMEINRLSKVLHQEVTKSRQHFLRLEFPITYRNLINHDITDDYTMGYAEEPGFRASICTSFNFYDLDQDTETHLRIHPFAVMDGTLNDYLRLTPLQATEIIRNLISAVRRVNGTFMPLWHNQTLNDQGDWKGWLEVFEKMVQLGTEKD